MSRLLDFANMANRAYAVKPDIGAVDSSARAVLVDVDEGLSAGFPGTNNGKCVETDIEAWTHDAGALGNVHRGTYAALDSIWDGLSALSPSVVYGHSLGGMLALMYGARLCEIGKPPKFIYAYEPAKISTDGKIAALFVEHGVTVIITRNGNDFVPTWPAIPFEDWQHPAPVLHIGKALLPFPNAEDHMMDKVIISVQDYLLTLKAT